MYWAVSKNPTISAAVLSIGSINAPSFHNLLASQGIVVNAMHPGWADTPGARSSLPMFRKLTRAVLRTSEEGADTIVWLAVAREASAVSGKLFLDREVRSTHLLRTTIEPGKNAGNCSIFSINSHGQK